MKQCHRCGTEWVSEKKQPSVKEICPKCSAYYHCCLNCRFHDPTVHNECAIGTTEWVGDKAGLNFCDEFEFADAVADSAEHKQHEAARASLDRLFGGDLPKKDSDALDKLKNLFGD